MAKDKAIHKLSILMDKVSDPLVKEYIESIINEIRVLREPESNSNKSNYNRKPSLSGVLKTSDLVFDKQTWGYVLELEDGYWYAGYTSNLFTSIWDRIHIEDKRPKFALLHKPINIDFANIIKNMEELNSIVYSYMEVYGHDRVRSGSYINIDSDYSYVIRDKTKHLYNLGNNDLRMVKILRRFIKDETVNSENFYDKVQNILKTYNNDDNKTVEKEYDFKIDI